MVVVFQTACPKRVPLRAGRRRRFALALLTALLAAVALPLLIGGGARAQAYSFEVPNESLLVRINQDSSLDFWYTVEFKNDTDADPIDVVDMGMPTDLFDIGQCSAAENGQPLTDIRPSTVVFPGVEVHLGDLAIQPGQTGTFQFHGRNPQMVFQDTEHAGYASVEFKNTWWGSAYAHGETYLTFSVQFPPGVKPTETVYHREKYSSTSTAEGVITFTWSKVDAKPSEGYTHGVSFPAVYVSGVYPRQPLPDYKPVSSSSSGSSYSSSLSIIRVIFPLGFVLVAVLIRTILSFTRVRKKGAKVNYLKPSVGIEGAGPMKQLSPGEAAVITSQDLDRVAAVVYFEMLQKGLVSVQGTKPLVRSRASAPPAGSPGYYGTFLGAVSNEGTLDRGALKLAVTSLIGDVEKKLTGHSSAETAKYYGDAASAAWVEVKSITDHRQRIEKFNQHLPLLLLDSGFGSKVREAFGAGDFPLPAWALGLSRASSGGASGVAASPTGELTVPGGTFAELCAGGFLAVQDAAYTHVQEFEKELVKEVNPEEYRRVYMPYFGRGYGTGGGGGGGCACACAGCACACAGGGR